MQNNYIKAVAGDESQPQDPSNFTSVRPETDLAEEIPLNKRQSFFFEKQKFDPIELFWEDITITATMEKKIRKFPPCGSTIKEEKIILNNVRGLAKQGTFTAILGPSGCGKTTLLNFLSGRILSTNLSAKGALYVNSNMLNDLDIIGNKLAYVMQDDILMGTFTPREAFHFSAALRLKDSPAERTAKIESLLKDLGLLKCADTKIGTAVIRGVSGGERKRASIGVELLTNPSLIFLDEPTTGLDSATACNVIQLLKDVAKLGRTIVCTIHQPSSQIFDLFDRLMLMVNGHIIFQGESHQAIHYFRAQGYNCPQYANPATFFMQCMNPEGLMIQQFKDKENANIELTDEIKKLFDERVLKMVSFYKQSDYFKEMKNTFQTELKKDKSANSASFLTQFKYICLRGLLNELRDPMDVTMKIITTVFMAALTLIVFNDLGDGQKGIQGRVGAIFFLVMMQAFGSMQGTLLTFSIERPLFLRESLNKTYTSFSYYIGRMCSELPIHIFVPTASAAIVYFAIGLNTVYAWKFFVAVLILNGVYFFGASYGFMISVFIPKAEIAMSLVPVLIVPFILFSGFMVNVNDVPYIFYPWVYMSLFKYGYAAGLQNEFQDLPARDCTIKLSADMQNYMNSLPVSPSDKLKIQNYYKSLQTCDPLKDFDFRESMWTNIILVYCIAVGLRIISFYGLHKISNPKKMKLMSGDKNNGVSIKT